MNDDLCALKEKVTYAGHAGQLFPDCESRQPIWTHTHVYSRNVFKVIVPRGPYGSIMTFRSITGRVLWDYSTSSVPILRFLQPLISLQNISKVSLQGRLIMQGLWLWLPLNVSAERTCAHNSSLQLAPHNSNLESGVQVIEGELVTKWPEGLAGGSSYQDSALSGVNCIFRRRK